MNFSKSARLMVVGFLAGCSSSVLTAQTYTFSTLAGLAGVTGTSDGTGASSRFNSPARIAIDTAGNIFVGDNGNHSIRKITPAGVVTTFAGQSGIAGTADGSGTSARFRYPSGLAFDGAGNLFVADTQNYTIRKITSTGVVSTFAGVAGNRGTTNGVASSALFDYPSGLGIDSAGVLYVSEIYQNSIRKVSPAAVVTTFVSGVGLNIPYEVAVDNSNNVYVADGYNHVIRKITPAGGVSTLAGLVGVSGTADGTSSSARFNYPNALAVDTAGNVYVADSNSHTIRKITPIGVVTTIGGAAGIPGSTDGPGSLARFNLPLGIAVDQLGNLYVSDVQSHTVRKGIPAGGTGPVISTQPSSQLVNAGSSVSFTVVATGAPAPTYQWRRGGTAISGATNATYTILSVQLSDAGSYDVVVSNSAGSIASNAAVLSMNNVVSGSVVAWGLNDAGQTNVPAGLSGVMSAAAGQYHSVALKSDGTVVAWGGNSYGETAIPTGLTGVTTIAVHHRHNLAVKSDGTVVAWGANDYGQSTVPPGLTGVIAVAAGGSHSVALKSDGTVMAWGRNDLGQSTVPAGLTGVMAISAGADHSLALKTNGTVVGWGYNEYGQTSAPAGLTGMTAIAAGFDHSLALKNDGTVVAWGRNVAGDTIVPTGLTGVKAIAGGGTFSLALKNDGTVVAWGSNASGEATVPAGLIGVSAIAGGRDHAVVLVGVGASAPTISTQPANQTVSAGGTATFAVVASGTAPLTYQWRRDGGSIGGATSSTLTLANAQGTNAGTYLVVVSNGAGSVTSNAATLAVNNLSPAIITQPTANNIVNQGQTATLTVVATGTAPLTYQWLKDGTNVPGGTSAGLSLSNVQSANAGSYTVVVSNGAGSVTSTAATLMVVVLPTISTQPQSLSVIPGSAATFSVVASGTAPLGYQWFKDGAPVGGATGTALALSAVQTANAGNYTVVVSNSAGSVTSNAAALTVNPGVPPTITAQPGDQSVAPGTTATFTVGVSGTSPFAYQWRLNGAPIPGATTNPLILANVTIANGGSYTVVVTNAAGAANSATSSAAILSVIQPPTITTPPLDQSVAVGSNVVFSVVAVGAPLTYQWSKDGRAIAGQNNAILSLTNVTNNDAGSYTVAVSNGVGTTTTPAVTLLVSAKESKIINMSVRSYAGAGSETLIMGFVVSGQGAAKTVLVRGIGPTLANFGVSGALADPELRLFQDTVQLLSNNDWGAGNSTVTDQLAALFTTTGAFQLSRTSKDAALRTVLQPRAYTANVSSSSGTGIALVELYDADFPAATRLSNVSARSRVGTGEGVLIMGFAIRGNAPMKVLVRGIGPALATFGVPDALANPQLVLLKGDSEVIDNNDDWWKNGGAQALSPVFVAAGAFGLTSGTADAALVATLQPGSYSAKVSGADNTTGVALVEVYEVP